MDTKRKINLIITTVCAALAAVELVFLRNAFSKWIVILLGVMAVVVYAAYLYGLLKERETIYKFAMVCFYCAVLILALFWVLDATGVLSKFETVEDFKAYISNDIFGILLFILISFLQVTFIPIPSTVTTVAGTVIFGFAKGMLLSLAGQISGSLVAFWLGRKFGMKLVVWIVGQDMYDKYKQYISGRDKIILVLMFLLPFFPDDVLCMLAGLTTMTGLSFFLLILFSRVITISYTGALTALVAKIPLAGWGLLVYAAIAAVVIALFVICWKKGDVLEKSMMNLIYIIVPKVMRSKLIPKDELEKFEAEIATSTSDGAEAAAEPSNTSVADEETNADTSIT